MWLPKISRGYDADILGAMQRGLDQVYFNPLQKQIPDKFPTYEVTGIILDL